MEWLTYERMIIYIISVGVLFIAIVLLQKEKPYLIIHNAPSRIKADHQGSIDDAKGKLVLLEIKDSPKVLYKCIGMDGVNDGNPYFWWFEGRFHYEVDKKKYQEMTDLPEDLIPDWGAICNSETEEYIKKNCKPPFENDN